MSLDINEIVNVSIRIAAPVLTGAGFGRALILGSSETTGTSKISPDLSRLYTSLDAVAVDFDETDPEYQAARHLLAQSEQLGRSVQDFRIGYVAPSGDISDALQALVDAGTEWYCTLLTSRTTADILDASQWTETQEKILLAQTSETATRDSAYNPTTPGSDLGSVLKANSRNRTALFWHADDTEYLDAAMAGLALPQSPGTLTWALKQLSEVVASSLTPTQYSNLTGTTTAPTSGKNVNVYAPLTSQAAIVQRGMMSSGRFIDVQRSVDYLRNRYEVGIGNLLLTLPKLPYSNEGIERVANVVRSENAAAKELGILDAEAEFLVSAPAVADVSAENRANRVLPPITNQVRLAGAIHFTQLDVVAEI